MRSSTVRSFQQASLAVAVLACTTVSVAASPIATLIGPTNPYLSFADSPFAGGAFDYFHLEDLEDGLFNSPGVSATEHIVAGHLTDSFSDVDSVDADDGAIDGSGLNGHSMWVGNRFSPAITLIFSGAALGNLPTHVGLAWTDGINDVQFEAFDPFHASLGVINASPAGVAYNGDTAEDTFFGVIYSGGISHFTITSGLGGGQSGIEIDHIQYGYGSSGPAVPEPATYAMAAMALLGFGVIAWRRRGRSMTAGRLHPDVKSP